MKQATVKFLLYSGIGVVILAAVLFTVVTLLSWLTPSVSVQNNSQQMLSEIVIQLPSNTLRFDNIAPGESGDIFYDAAQKDGHYGISLKRGTELIHATCGLVTDGEWGKRMVISISATLIDCKEQLRF